MKISFIIRCHFQKFDGMLNSIIMYANLVSSLEFEDARDVSTCNPAGASSWCNSSIVQVKRIVNYLLKIQGFVRTRRFTSILMVSLLDLFNVNIAYCKLVFSMSYDHWWVFVEVTRTSKLTLAIGIHSREQSMAKCFRVFQSIALIYGRIQATLIFGRVRICKF
jgi:hypothetical protein